MPYGFDLRKYVITGAYAVPGWNIRLREEAGLPKIGLHGPRHTFASLLLQSGTDLKTVSTALGHSSVAITADLYSHISPVMLRTAADRLNDLIEKRA